MDVDQVGRNNAKMIVQRIGRTRGANLRPNRNRTGGGRPRRQRCESGCKNKPRTTQPAVGSGSLRSHPNRVIRHLRVSIQGTASAHNATRQTRLQWIFNSKAVDNPHTAGQS